MLSPPYSYPYWYSLNENHKRSLEVYGSWEICVSRTFIQLPLGHCFHNQIKRETFHGSLLFQRNMRFHHHSCATFLLVERLLTETVQIEWEWWHFGITKTSSYFYQENKVLLQKVGIKITRSGLCFQYQTSSLSKWHGKRR